MMFSRVAVRLVRPAGFPAVSLASPVARHARFASFQAVDGSKGRKMPSHRPRATTPAPYLDATFTIRV